MKKDFRSTSRSIHRRIAYLVAAWILVLQFFADRTIATERVKGPQKKYSAIEKTEKPALKKTELPAELVAIDAYANKRGIQYITFH